MKHTFFALLGSLLVAGALVAIPPAQAAVETVTLDVPGMTCPLCPITIKKALTKVDGVVKVEVSYFKKEAIVSYDDSKASVEALLHATKNAGYPSIIKSSAAR